MPTYRAYLIDGDDRVASYKPIDAETDAEALRPLASLRTAVMLRFGISKDRAARA